MDKGTLDGVVAGVLLVGGSVAMGSGVQIFLSPSSLLIVFGGTLAATAILKVRLSTSPYQTACWERERVFEQSLRRPPFIIA